MSLKIVDNARHVHKHRDTLINLSSLSLKPSTRQPLPLPPPPPLTTTITTRPIPHAADPIQKSHAADPIQQTPVLNQSPWDKLNVLFLTKQGREVYIAWDRVDIYNVIKSPNPIPTTFPVSHQNVLPLQMVYEWQQDSFAVTTYHSTTIASVM